jgi:hypothetical protein
MKKNAQKNDLWDVLGPLSTPTTSGTLESRVDAIAEADLLEPNMPIGVFVQEAYNIAVFAQDDEALFKAKGFDWRIAEELPRRIELLRKREAEWWKERFGKDPSKKELDTWVSLFEKAKKEIMRDLEFAFPDDTDVRRLLKKIRKGSGYIDDIDDLSLLHAMAVDRSAGLAAIGSRPELKDDLGRCLKKIPLLFAENIARGGNSSGGRDRAYVFCAAALEALRRCARYALWDDKERLKGYASEYFRKSARKKRAQQAVASDEGGGNEGKTVG